MHVFVEYNALGSAIARWVVSRKLPDSGDEFNVDVVTVVRGVVIHSSVEICCPTMMVDVGLAIVEDKPLRVFTDKMQSLGDSDCEDRG